MGIAGCSFAVFAKNYPDAMKSAIEAYKCFEPYGRDVEEYARVTAFIPESYKDAGYVVVC